MESEVLQLIPLPEVVRISGISKSEIFRRIKEGRFPAPARIGESRCTRWELGEVQSWVKERLSERTSSQRPEHRPAA